MEDRRKYKRIAKCFMSWLRFKQKRKKTAYPFGWDMVTACDLGAGGMLFNYDKPVDIGTKIQLRIVFPFKETPIDCIGRVVRNEKVDSYMYSSIYRIGAQFESISVPDKDLIDNVANEMCA